MRTSGVVRCLVGLLVLAAAAAAQADVTGTVFRDGDFDGSRDAGETGFGGVTIVARADGDRVMATTSSTGDGTYRLAIPPSEDVLRIEFALPGWPLVETSIGPDSRGSVRFVTDGEWGVDLGMADPAGYCKAAPDLCAAVSQDGAGAGGAGAATVVRLANDGRSVATIATAADTGSVFGLAVAGDGSLFTAAYLRRSAPFGPAGPGGIYRADPAGHVAPLVHLEEIGVAFTAGTDPHTPGSDAAAWPLVGRSSLGGLLLERSDSRLLVVNLASRELVRIPTSGVITSATADRTPITSPCSNAGDGSDADWRPFAIAALEGVRYVGGVCDGASTADPADVVAHVVRQKPDGTFESVLAIPVADHGYGPWDDSLAAVPISRPQPLFAGLAFSGPDLVLGIRDRYGDQLGLGDEMPDGSRPGAAATTGLTLRACLAADGWKVMTGPTRPGSCVASDAAALPAGGAMGGVSNAGSEIAVSSHGPAVQWLDALTGDVRATRPLGSSFGPVGGIGSLSPVCGAAPVEIAGRTFADLDGDGAQDAGDYGIGGVSVHLRDENGTLATTTTDGEGVYRFRVAPNSSYAIFIDRGETELSGRTAARTDVIEDRVDSDGVATRTGWSADVVTGAAGLHRHHVDFGFLASAEFDLSLTLEPVVSPVGPIAGGETIELRLGVVNEGLTTVSRAAVGLYLSAGSTFDLGANPGWTLVAQNPTVSLPAPLAPGATAIFSVVVGARYGFAQSAFRVGAEIVSADGTDADSTPDTDPTNDAAGEDDRASIDVPVTNRYDLALTLEPLPGGLVTAPDAVAYAVRVTNQGAITVENHELTVYLPAEITAEPADNPGWSRIGATLVTRVEGPLEPGGNVQRIVIVHLPSSQTLHGTLLAAEVSDDDGVDADSIPNNSPADDAVGGDGLTDSTLGDEDDHDIASFPTRAIANTVFDDRDADGDLDRGEVGIPGVLVRLLDGFGRELEARHTDAKGRYLFADLSPGRFRVEVVAPSGYGPSVPAHLVSGRHDAAGNGVIGRSIVRSQAVRLTIAATADAPIKIGLVRRTMLVVHVRPSNTRVLVGSLVRYRVQVGNAGRATAFGVRICADVPHSFRLVRAWGARTKTDQLACWRLRRLRPGRGTVVFLTARAAGPARSPVNAVTVRSSNAATASTRARVRLV